MKVSMNIDGVCLNVIAEKDSKEISFHFPGCAHRKHVRAAENKCLGIISGNPAPLTMHMEIARDPMNNITKYLCTKTSLNKEDFAFFRLRMIGIIRLMNAHGHVGTEGINISIKDFEPIEQTRICSMEPYDLPKLEIIQLENETMQDENDIYEDEDVDMLSFTSRALVVVPTPSSVEKTLNERCPEHILHNKKWKLTAENMLYEGCKPSEFIAFLDKCDKEITDNEDVKREFLRFTADNALNKLKITNELEKLKVTNELEILKVQKTSELEKLKVEVEKIKETNRTSLADKKIERVKQDCLKIKAEYQKLSLMKKQTSSRPATVEEIRATNVRVIPSHLEGRRVIGNEIYASNEDDLKENDIIIEKDDASVPMVVTKSKTYIQRRLDLCREDFRNSNSKKKTYLLTNDADMNALGDNPDIFFHGIIENQNRFSKNHRGCGGDVDCALGLFRKNDKLVARALFRKT